MEERGGETNHVLSFRRDHFDGKIMTSAGIFYNPCCRLHELQAISSKQANAINLKKIFLSVFGKIVYFNFLQSAAYDEDNGQFHKIRYAANPQLLLSRNRNLTFFLWESRFPKEYDFPMTDCLKYH